MQHNDELAKFQQKNPTTKVSGTFLTFQNRDAEVHKK